MGLCLFLYVSGDVAHCETSDHAVKSRASDATYSQGVRGYILKAKLRLRNFRMKSYKSGY